MIGKRSRTTSLIIDILTFIFLALILAFVLALNNSRFNSWVSNHLYFSYNSASNSTLKSQYEFDYSNSPNLDSQTININYGMGDLTFQGESNNILEVSSSNKDVDIKKNLTENSIIWHINLGENSNYFNFSPSRKYTVTDGSSTIPTDINIDQGMGNGTFNMEDLNINSLYINLGTGNETLNLTSTSIPKDTLTLKVGTGNINLNIPSNVGYKIEYNIGLGSLDTPSTTLHGNGTYTSPNYTSANKALNINAQIGLGKISIND